MPRPAVVLALLAAPVATAAEPPARPDPVAVDRMVAQLADPEYGRREKAARDLDALGPAALDPLRVAARSADPELARRARDLAGRIGRRADNARALAPTVVAVKADAAPLAAVLADLSRQAGFPVVVGGPNATEVADDPVTVDTGRVPFWEAVRAVNQAADLRVRAVNDFLAPGSTPLTGPERQAQPVVILEAAGVAPPRPAAVYGGVLVEAVRVPAAPPSDAAVTLLLVWPEPRIDWQATRGAWVGRAADAGRELAAFPDAPAPTPQSNADRVVVMRQLGGRRALIEEAPGTPPPLLVPGFTPNPRQAVVRLKPGGGTARVDLSGAVAGVVRVPPEPLVRLTGMTAGEAADASHPAGVELRAVLAEKDGRWKLTADLVYDPADVAPTDAAGRAAPLGMRDGRAGAARVALAGLRVADAAGRPYTLDATTLGRPFVAGVGRVAVRVAADLTPGDGPGYGPPAAVEFWGTYSKAVEVPFTLTGVPLTGGTK